MCEHWLADRTRAFDASGIRKVFDLGATMCDPINLSIGQPDFDVPEPVKQAAIQAIASGKNGYALSQGLPALREKLLARVRQQYGHDNRDLLVTSGTSGGLMLAMLALLNPGDEMIVFDPYFPMYTALAAIVGAKVVAVDTYPDFRIDPDRVAAAVTPRTKIILLNSPANPTGAVAGEDEVRGLAELAARRNVVLLSDEIYREFCYDRPFVSPAAFNPQTLVVDGFSKSCGMPGWRLGFAHGPAAVIREMVKLQQYSFVCAAACAMGRPGGDGRGHGPADRRLSPQAEHGGRGARRRLRLGGARRGLLRLSAAALGQRHGVFNSRDREASTVDHTRQRFQRPRHAFPPLLRGVRRDAGPRHRGPATPGAGAVR